MNTVKIVSVFKNGNSRAIRIPRDFDFEGVNEMTIIREGDTIMLRPVRPSWTSLTTIPCADSNFLIERDDVVSDEGRFYL